MLYFNIRGYIPSLPICERFLIWPHQCMVGELLTNHPYDCYKRMSVFWYVTTRLCWIQTPDTTWSLEPEVKKRFWPIRESATSCELNTDIFSPRKVAVVDELADSSSIREEPQQHSFPSLFCSALPPISGLFDCFRWKQGWRKQWDWIKTTKM